MIRYALGPDARARELAKTLDQHARIAICGGANTGKTTLADTVTDRAIVCADTWKDYPIVEQPWLIVAACAELDRFVVEGTLVVRALRKGLQVDCLLWLVNPQAEQNAGQKAQAKGLATVFESIREKLSIPVVVIP